MNTLFQLLLPASLLFAAPTADAPASERGDKIESRAGKKAKRAKKAKRVKKAKRDKKAKTREKARDHRTRMKKRFARMDTDGSGEISFDEMVATKKDRERSKDARKSDKRGGKKSFAKGEKNPRKANRKALRGKKRGKKSFANRGNDRHRFAKRNRNAA